MICVPLQWRFPRLLTPRLVSVALLVLPGNLAACVPNEEVRSTSAAAIPTDTTLMAAPFRTYEEPRHPGHDFESVGALLGVLQWR